MQEKFRIMLLIEMNDLEIKMLEFRRFLLLRAVYLTEMVIAICDDTIALCERWKKIP